MPPAILLVDWYDQTRRALADLLRLGGYSVVEARSGVGGLRAAREQPPSVVIVDLWPSTGALPANEAEAVPFPWHLRCTRLAGPAGDPDQIGRILEQERLVRSLGAVGGLDEPRAKRIAERYGTVWSLRQAGPDEVSRAAEISREEAERIRHSL